MPPPPDDANNFSAGDGKSPCSDPNLEWEAIKESLRQHISEEDFSRWVKPLSHTVVSSNEVVIHASTMEHYHFVLDNFLDTFETCKAQLDISTLFRFEIFESPSPYIETRESTNPAGVEPDPMIRPGNQDADEIGAAVSRALSTYSHINPEYRFENFVNGPSNQFAHASCLAVADAPGQNYNPLFLYGSTGLGKTHLLHAVGNSVLQNDKSRQVTYISSERFMNEMIYCLRFNKMWDFRKKYRSCDVLLVDDIQFISGKERTQEEFFHTFNALYESKQQIIVTSDVFPQDIPDIEERLRNRFQWGLIADIQPPDVEHRVAILMNKAEKTGVTLSNEAAQYIATQAKGSVRVLEGALRRVIAHASLRGRPLDIELVSEVLQDIIGADKKEPTIELIQKTVAEHFKLRISDLKSKKRHRSLSIPRQIAMFLARERTKISFPDIGEKFGGKDHSTVMHAKRKIEKDKRKDLELRSNIEAIERKLDLQL